jgi:hypothetical protein
MAFCTTCGATVNGAFCNQCGTPVSAPSGGAQAPPPQQPAPGMTPPPGAAAAAPVVVKRGTSPIVWVLVIVLGLFVFGILAVVGTGFFVFHKARQAGLDPELLRRNPGLAVS